MRRVVAMTAPMVVWVGLFGGGCDSAVSDDLLNGNEFTNMESKLEALGPDGNPMPSTSLQDGELQTAYPLSAFGPLTLQPRAVSAAKLDDDAYDDLIVRYFYGNCRGCEASAVRFSPPDGRTDPAGHESARIHGVPLEAADLDGDGRPELVGIDQEVGQIHVYDASTGEERARIDALSCLTTAAEPAGPPWGHLNELASDRIAPYRLVDVDGDRRADLVCVGRWARDGSQESLVVEPIITIHLARTDEIGFSEPIEQRWSGYLRAFGDFDGDGNLDYLVQTTPPPRSATEPGLAFDQWVEAATLELAVAYGDGKGSFGDPLRVYRDADLLYGNALVAGDFDGDGVSDLVWLDDLTSCKEELLDPESGCPTGPDGRVRRSDPVILFGSNQRGESFVRSKPFATNLLLDNTVLSYAADLDADGAAELIQIGPDVEFGIEIEPFLRVTQLVDGDPVLVSSTRLRYPRDTSLPTEGGLNFRVTTGNFVAGGGTELLVVETRSGQTTIYRWVQ